MRSGKVSASQIQDYLKGIDYPADKQKLIQIAKSNNAPESVMTWLNKLPDRQYSRANEVQEEFGKLK